MKEEDSFGRKIEVASIFRQGSQTAGGNPGEFLEGLSTL